MPHAYPTTLVLLMGALVVNHTSAPQWLGWCLVAAAFAITAVRLWRL